jgi:hypothetical protein
MKKEYPKLGTKYLYVSQDSCGFYLSAGYWTSASMHEKLFNSGNYFTTRKEAQAALKKIKAIFADNKKGRRG